MNKTPALAGPDAISNRGLLLSHSRTPPPSTLFGWLTKLVAKRDERAGKGVFVERVEVLSAFDPLAGFGQLGGTGGFGPKLLSCLQLDKQLVGDAY